MEFWETLWKIVFFVGVSIFGAMAIWVTIWGFFDIKKLFQRIKEPREEG
jgi:hypothetical protein